MKSCSIAEVRICFFEKSFDIVYALLPNKNTRLSRPNTKTVTYVDIVLFLLTYFVLFPWYPLVNVISATPISFEIVSRHPPFYSTVISFLKFSDI